MTIEDSEIELEVDLLSIKRSLRDIERLAAEAKVTAEAARVQAQETQKAVSDLVEIFVAVKGGVKVVSWLFTFLKWLTAAVTIVAALYGAFVAFKSGKFPTFS